jgi:hypothetical protein
MHAMLCDIEMKEAETTKTQRAQRFFISFILCVFVVETAFPALKKEKWGLRQAMNPAFINVFRYNLQVNP